MPDFIRSTFGEGFFGGSIGAGTGGGGLWEPSDESGAFFLLRTDQLAFGDVDDVDASADVSDGDRINTLRDRIGVRHMTAVANANEAIVGGSPSFHADFDGTDDLYTAGGVAADYDFLHNTGGVVALYGAISDLTLFQTLTATASNSNDVGITLDFLGSASNELRLLIADDDGTARLNQTSAINIITDTNDHSLMVVYDNSSVRFYVDGALHSSHAVSWAAVGLTATSRLTLGARPSGSSPSNINVYSEYVVDDASYTDSEADQLAVDFHNWTQRNFV